MKNQRGSALIQVVIAASIFSVMSLAVNALISSQQKSISFLEDKLSKVDLNGLLIGDLNEKDACTATLVGLDVAQKQAVTSIHNKKGQVIYSSTDKSKSTYNRLTITKMELENVSVANGPNESGEMKLIVFTKRQRVGGGPVDFSPFEISLKVRTDINSKISYCKAYGDGSGASEFDPEGEYPCGASPGGTGDYSHGERWRVSSGSNKDRGESTVTSYQNYKCQNGSWIYTGNTTNECGNCLKTLF